MAASVRRLQSQLLESRSPQQQRQQRTADDSDDDDDDDDEKDELAVTADAAVEDAARYSTALQPEDIVQAEEFLRNAAAAFSGPLDPPLYAGEVVLAKMALVIERALSLQIGDIGTLGTLFITNFRLQFVADERSTYLLHSNGARTADCEIPLATIATIYRIVNDRRVPVNSESILDVLEVETKDIRVVRFDFRFAKKDRETSAPFVLQLLQLLADRSPLRSFAFAHVPPYPKHVPDWMTGDARHLGPPTAGGTWVTRACFESELERTNACQTWRLSVVNNAFTLCESYPAVIVCPMVVQDAHLYQVALDYVDAGPPIWCWSQRHSGLSICRSNLWKLGSIATPACATYLNAIKNASASECAVLDISGVVPSRVDIRISYAKLWSLCTGPVIVNQVEDNHWLTNLEDTKWLGCVGAMLSTALEVVKRIDEQKVSVVIKAAQYRDGLCAVSSLAQLMLDSHYRTIRGFAKLIQKEWISLGHPFGSRNGSCELDFTFPSTNSTPVGSPPTHSKSSMPSTPTSMPFLVSRSEIIAGLSTANDEETPVFLLFLDCVQQLLRQFPLSFEFTDDFLVFLFDQTLSGEHGTFLMNCDHERDLYLVPERTPSLWARLEHDLNTSPPPEPHEDSESHREDAGKQHAQYVSVQRLKNAWFAAPNPAVLKPVLLRASLTFFDRMFLRWIPQYAATLITPEQRSAGVNGLRGKLHEARQQLRNLKTSASARSSAIM